MAEDVPYQSLYRRFRPQRFDELKGQDHVALALKNAVREERVGHFYLFSGPRGTGKTSTARILGKALNCTNLEDGEPCGTCESCVHVQLGTSLDVHEMDAASNNGVDAMRDLVARTALGTPGRWKVYIVDEVHMLSTAAANALLKTLEEPPGHVVFVLATTDPQKVLPTIRSRAQHLEFRLLRPEVLTEHLRYVNQAAGLGVPLEAIDLAVRKGAGSARDALSMLDQVAAAGTVDDEVSVIDELMDALCERDTGRALAAVAEATATGRDPRRLAEELLAQLRNAFLATMARSLVALPDDAVAQAEDQGRRLGPAGMTRAMEAVGDALTEMREALDLRVCLEVALVRLTRPEVDATLPALLERVERLERGLAGVSTAPVRAEARQAAAPSSPAPAPASATSSGRALGAVRKAQKAAAGAAPKSAERVAAPNVAAPSVAALASAPTTGGAFPTRDDLTAAWADEILPKLSQRARARFRVGRWVSADGGVAQFALPNEPHRKMSDEVRGDVEETVGAHFGVRVPIKLVVDQGEHEAPAAPAPQGPDDHVDLGELEDAPAVTSPEERLKEAFPGAEEVPAQ
jgi:DNA polymerase-3 subunit gamma/tau